MNIYFHINYRTNYGEELVLNLVTTDVNNDQQVAQYRMSTFDGEQWSCQLKLSSTILSIHYYYSVDCEGREKRHEWLTEAHFVELNANENTDFDIYDKWIDIPEDSYLYSSAFTDCINFRGIRISKGAQRPMPNALKLIVRAPQLHRNQQLAIVGEDKYLGAWDPTRAIPMTEHCFNEWTITLDATRFTPKKGASEFKFVVIDNGKRKKVLWEVGENRKMPLPSINSIRSIVTVHHLEQAFFEISNTKVAGTLVPVFSLRTKGSFGVGDFGDLKKMVEWVASTKQRLLQVLPINDTTTTHTWTDSYPYSCISIFALHPQYVDLRRLPAIEDENEMKKFEELREELNALPQIDYERVNNAKNEYLKLIYQQEGSKMLKTSDFKTFFKESESWLVPYAQYCSLRDKY
ncbi:MAG: 4-alpha-glucanotransferase, partial [Prevotella sp.]|nr:4-alpha-glucanotransferase [Prevotella sp.]